MGPDATLEDKLRVVGMLELAISVEDTRAAFDPVHLTWSRFAEQWRAIGRLRAFGPGNGERLAVAAEPEDGMPAELDAPPIRKATPLPPGLEPWERELLKRRGDLDRLRTTGATEETDIDDDARKRRWAAAKRDLERWRAIWPAMEDANEQLADLRNALTQLPSPAGSLAQAFACELQSIEQRISVPGGCTTADQAWLVSHQDEYSNADLAAILSPAGLRQDRPDALNAMRKRRSVLNSERKSVREEREAQLERGTREAGMRGGITGPPKTR